MTEKVNCECPMLKYGPTNNPHDAVFIMPDGRMVNGVDKINGITVHRRPHREIVTGCVPSDTAQSKSDARWRWMQECHAIRIDTSENSRLHVESRSPPTPQQTEVLFNAVKGMSHLTATANKCPLVGKGENCYCDVFISNPRPEDIHRWINKCWR